jgi:hypothetical protein
MTAAQIADVKARTTLVDVTSPVNAAIVEAKSSGRALHLPSGTYLITSSLTTIAGQFTMFGDGPFRTRLQFTPTANDTLLELSNGAEQCERVRLRDLNLYSAETTFKKVAIDAIDISVCSFERIYINGTGGAGNTWFGAESIGLRTNGRNATVVRGIEIDAERPIYIAANPNTDATDCQDMDHFHFEDCYLLADGFPIIEVAAGLGLQHVTFDGYQAWIFGTNGFKMNDNRAAPTIESRNIVFKNVRGEQGESASGYWFDMAFTAPCQFIGFESVFGASGTQGIKINAVRQLKLDTVFMSATGESLNIDGLANPSVVEMHNCWWATGSTFAVTGYTNSAIFAYDSASYAGPNTAVYASDEGVFPNSVVRVAQLIGSSVAGGTGLIVNARSGGDQLRINPQAAGSGVRINSVNAANTDFEPAFITAEGFTFNNRTGVGTSAQALNVDANNNQVMGPLAALATDATNGFLYVPTCAGTPTGTPTAKTGKVALVFDTTNNELYVYDGAWISVALA